MANRLIAAFAAALIVLPLAAQEAPAQADFTVELEVAEDTPPEFGLWFHPRAVVVPAGVAGEKPVAYMTLQKHLDKSDFYSGLYVMRSEDLGENWTEPEEIPSLSWTHEEGGEIVRAVADVTPGWHAPTQKILAIGAKVRYRDGHQLYDTPGSRGCSYAVGDPTAEGENVWSEWRNIELPHVEDKFYLTTSGCVQWLVEDDGTLLIPFYFSEAIDIPNRSTVMRCSFDGETIRYIEHGDELAIDVDRGFVEPSLIKLGDTYYLTLRNDQKGYVTKGDDGLHFEDPIPWTFDDGEELGSYNTQQHWLKHDDKLYLSYTRRGANNDHLMRHRAPLFIAEVDRDTLQVLRATEQVLVPERGATLGNFGANPVSENEWWVTVGEGLFTPEAKKREEPASVFVSRVRWPE